MRIGIIGSFGSKIPLKDGQVHASLLLTHSLAAELSKMGHEVTYFGSYDKEITKKTPLLKYNNLNYEPRAAVDGEIYADSDFRLLYEEGYISKVLELEKEFDLFYSWASFRIAPFVRLIKKPVVLSHHESMNAPSYSSIFCASGSNNLHIMPISNSLKKILDCPNLLKPVYNGIDPDEITFTEKPEDYFCWVGRIMPSKGLHIAIDLANKLNFKLKVVGPMDKFKELGDLTDYDNLINKKIYESKNVDYLGYKKRDETLSIISKAKGLIFPTDGTEACPMVVIEAMASGTPVVAFNAGPLPELVEENVTGFLCDKEEEMADKIKLIAQIDRVKCRDRALERFSLRAMANGYENEFQKIINQRKWSWF